MNIKDKNFVITKDENVRKILLANDLTEVPNCKGDFFVFVNEPKKFQKFYYDELDITFTNKLYF